jgi:formyl-CoA transferase
MQLQNELKGLSVVSLEQAVSAPYCGMLLADAGARVIKVERPEGDFARGYDTGANGESAIFAWLNRGKQSICLDLNSKKDRALLVNMLTQVDIFLSNLAPGALDRKGLSAVTIRKLNPKIINCSISGYDLKGPLMKRKAYDFLVQGEVGLCSVTGTAENPARVGISITDIATGLTAFSAILRALIQRSINGSGVDIDLSMFDVMAEWMNMPLLGHRYMGGAPERTGLSHSFVAPYGAFKTKDKKNILLSIQNNREWESFCVSVLKSVELVNNQKFKTNIERYKNKSELEKIISDIFIRYNKKSLINNLRAASIAYANLNSVEDLSEHIIIKNKKINYGSMIVSVADLPISNNQNVLSKAPSLNENEVSIRNEFGLFETKTK